MNGRRPSPVECLALLAPAPKEIDLLRACLWNGRAAQDAWARWQRAVGDPLAAIQRNVSGIKALLPLLHYGARQRSTDPAMAPVRHALAAAYARETARWQAYARVSARAFDALASGGIPFLALKGGALAVLAYPEPATRHSHGIDVLIETGDLERAAAVLHAAGFAPHQPSRMGAQSIRLVSADHVPIEVHTRQYRLPYYRTAMSDLWGRAVECGIAGARVRTPSPADHLVYVCGQASCCATRDSLEWIADAWFLAQHPNLHWPTVLDTTEASRLTLPLAVMLSALADHFDAPVPSTVLESLVAAAAGADRAAQDIAIAGLRAGRRGRLRDLFRATSTWRGRIALACSLLAPSPTALRLGEPLRYPRAWPAYYVLRPSAYAARRFVKSAAFRR